MNLKAAIEKVLTESKKRNFVQSIELAVSLKHVDFKKAEYKFTEEVPLPHGRGKDIKIGVFGNADMIKKAKDAGLSAFSATDLDKLATNKRKSRKIIREHEYFLAQPDMMVKIGKILGATLGPKGKMPKPVPPQANIGPLVDRLKKSVRIRLRDQPVIHAPFGVESMSKEQLEQNANTLLKAIEKKLPSGRDNIANVYIKTTMGKVVSLYERVETEES